VSAANLVVNGSFDADLTGWQSTYDHEGESWYAENYQHVAVVKIESCRKNVLQLHVKDQYTADNPGVKADSFPIPVKPGGQYKFSVYARSTGPNCRIMLEGYKWRPDVKPHDNPSYYDLRKAYKFEQVFFGQVAGGSMGGVGRAWKRATVTVPQTPMKELQQKLFDGVQFLIVHVVAIGGGPGDLFVDDIELERIN
jgi:hypothetical protein